MPETTVEGFDKENFKAEECEDEFRFLENEP